MTANHSGMGMKNKTGSSNQRMAVYELAKELGMTNQDLLTKVHAMGIDAKNHMSRLLPEDIERIHKVLVGEQPAVPTEERLSATVIRRRAKEPSPAKPIESAAPTPPVMRTPPRLPEQKEKEVPQTKIEPVAEATESPIFAESSIPDMPLLEPEDGNPSQIEAVQAVPEESTLPEPAPAPEEAIAPLSSVPSETETSAPKSAEKQIPTVVRKNSIEGLGPTGRVIDLSALRTPSFGPAKSVAGTSRGPRQEITGERLRVPNKERQPHGKHGKKVAQPALTRKAQATQITTAAEHKRVFKMAETVIIKELASQIGVKATEVLKKVWELGMRSVMINSAIDFDAAQVVAGEFGWRAESNVFQESSIVTEQEDAAEDLLIRAPVITIMGHVDHGKTSLLDAIRNANVAAGEAGGITQHIGAYKIKSSAGDVVFLDTPGHEAFTEMRARGAQATDIVVLVVAADDGVMPQTLEALNHAKDAEVPIVVAVNKIDKPGAQPERIRQQLASYGLNPEEWGGNTIYVDVSARTKAGVDKLLEMLALQAEVLELKANPNKAGKGLVIEARMDAKRGPVTTILVQEGTLRVGDTIVVGEELGKVRAMMDDKGKTLSAAGPSTPVEILGLSGVPRAGDIMNAVSDDRAAKELVEHRRQRRIDKDRAKAGPVSLDKLLDAMKAGLKELKIILKADVQGSVEALSNALVKLSNNQFKVTLVQAGVGGITETDVNLAKAGNAIILGFHVRPAGKAASLAEQEGVEIKLYDIIYDAIEDIKKAGLGLLSPVKREKILGKAEVRQTFNVSKQGTIAGCNVIEGIIRRNAQVRLVRDSVPLYQGRLGSLRRFKDDVREVQQGYECGLSIEGYNDIKTNDIVECFEVEEVAATLNPST